MTTMDGFYIIAGHMKGGKYSKFQSLQQIDAHLFPFIPPTDKTHQEIVSWH